MRETPERESQSVEQSGRGQELRFIDVVHFFRRNWRLVIGPAALTGVGTALVLFLVVPRKYEASATLVIVPPRFSSELKPQTLTVQSYQKILESDAVVLETKKRVVRQGFWSIDKPLRLGKELESRIFVSRRAEETTLAPMLQAVTRGRTGEQAAAIANTWAEVFLERTRELAVGSTSSTVQFIDQEYPRVRDALAKLEDARATEANVLQERHDRTATSWDDKITTLKNATTQLVADYEAETRRLVETFNSTKSLDNRGAQLEALRKAYSDLQDEQARVASQLQLKQFQLEAARRQLASTAPLVTLQKAMTDESVWRSMADAKGGNPDWATLQQRSLATQEVNPVYTALSEKVAEIEMDVNAMVPRAAGLTKDLDRINEEMKLL
jgi:capsular polysaccharide biosynthesis protein